MSTRRWHQNMRLLRAWMLGLVEWETTPQHTGILKTKDGQRLSVRVLHGMPVVEPAVMVWLDAHVPAQVLLWNPVQELFLGPFQTTGKGDKLIPTWVEDAEDALMFDHEEAAAAFEAAHRLKHHQLQRWHEVGLTFRQASGVTLKVQPTKRTALVSKSSSSKEKSTKSKTVQPPVSLSLSQASTLVQSGATLTSVKYKGRKVSPSEDVRSRSNPTTKKTTRK